MFSSRTTARRAALAPLLVAALVGIPATSAFAQAAEDVAARDQIVLSGDAQVAKGQAAGEIVVATGTASVDGVARGDVVVLHGPIRVSGQVAGSVIALDGRVALDQGAQVGGDVLAGGEVTLGEGATVGGEVRERVAFSLRGPLEAVGRLLGWLAVSVSTLLLGLLLILLAPRAADAIANATRSAPVASSAWGLFWLIALPAGSALLAASLLGLPLGLAVLLGLLLLLFVGYSWSAWALGRAIVGEERNRALAFLAGWFVVRAVALAPYVDSATWVVGAGFGLGAMTVASWRVRRIPGKHRAGRPPEIVIPVPEEEPARGWD